MPRIEGVPCRDWGKDAYSAVQFSTVRRAVIDVGSNSIIASVMENLDGVWVQIREEVWVTALGKGTKSSGLLAEDSMVATLDALQKAYQICEGLRCDSIVAAATMAARIATNTQDFLDRCLAQGTPVSVLSGDDEARLGFESVANDPKLVDGDTLTIVDPGGHSTEIVTAKRLADGSWKTVFRKSFAVGAVALRDEILTDEAPSISQRLRAVQMIDEEFGMSYLPFESGTVVVLGATGTNLISIREKMTEWCPDQVHGATLDYEEVSRAFGWMCQMTDSERAQIIGMEKGRERTIHAGALILERALYAVKALECKVSVRGWRHALIERGTL